MSRLALGPVGRRLGAVGLALFAGACDGREAPPPPAAPVYPAGTVLAVDGVPVAAAEVDRWAAVTALMEPDKVQAHWRRLALSNVVLPLRAGEALDPEGRRAAFAHAERLRGLAVELGRIPDDADLRDVAEGTWKQVGLIDWEVARGLPAGAWSSVYETPGGWAFLRLLEQPDGAPGEAFGPTGPVPMAVPMATGPTGSVPTGPVSMARVRFERVHVFYLAPEGLRTLLDEALRQLPIEVVAPEWEPLVPPLFLQHTERRTP